MVIYDILEYGTAAPLNLTVDGGGTALPGDIVEMELTMRNPGRRGDVVDVEVELRNPDAEGVPDGMKVDVQGNVFCTGAGGIWVVAPSGEVLGVIEVPETPANLAWGGPDLKTLYITARTGLYRVQTQTGGASLVTE